jgi:hypothetical protein
MSASGISLLPLRLVEEKIVRAETLNHPSSDYFWIDRVMRPERCSDDESDSYPRIGYQHFIDSSRACLALESGISLELPL